MAIAEAPLLPTTSALLERTGEIETIDAVLARGCSGSGSMLLIEGPCGIGKSSLLAEARRRARALGVQVLETSGGELERGYPLGLVLRLVEARIARAKAEERAALFQGQAALVEPLLSPPAPQLGRSEPTDEFALVHSLYWLVANIADMRPVVLVADDLQWGDDLSLRFLVYLAQRLDDLPVTIIGAVRTGDPAADAELVARLSLQAPATLRPRELSVEAVRDLLSDAGISSGEDDNFVHSSWQATGGNPFLLRELIAALRACPDRRSELSLRDFAPESVMRSVVLRVSRLGEEATAIARAIAVLGDGTPLVLAARLANADMCAAINAADRLASEQILSRADPAAFQHPMIRTAVYRRHSLGERADAHARAACLLRATGAKPDEIARHLIAGTPTDATWATDVLREAARVASLKGAPSIAAKFLRRIIECRPEDAVDPSVLLDLGIMEAAAGEDTALTHLEAALRCIDEPAERARAMYAHGQTIFRRGRQAEALAIFRRGADELGDGDRDLRLRFEAGSMAASAYLADRLPDADRRLQALVAGFPTDRALTPTERLLVLHHTTRRTMKEPRSEDHAAVLLETVGDGASLWRETSDGVAISHAIMALTWAGRPDHAEALASTVLRDARQRGDALVFAEISFARSMAMYARGRISEAMADAQAAIIGMHRGWSATVPAPQGILAFCLLDRGEVGDAEAVLEQVEHGLRDRETRLLNVWFYAARGRLRMLRGDARGALRDFRTIGELLAAGGMRNPTIVLVPWRSLAGVAAHATGDHDEATALIDHDIEIAREFGLPTAMGTALRAKALIADEGPDLALLSQSADLLEQEAGSPLELAHTLVHVGAAERRAGQRVRSRDALRRALDLAHQSGAKALEQFAHDELLASGARPRRPAVHGLDGLTPSEERIAKLMSEGHTSRSIAETLFLTMSTVEWHRRNIYRKLDVSSRDELRAVLKGAGR